jgi:hypothetical protein
MGAEAAAAERLGAAAGFPPTPPRAAPTGSRPPSAHVTTVHLRPSSSALNILPALLSPPAPCPLLLLLCPLLLLRSLSNLLRPGPLRRSSPGPTQRCLRALLGSSSSPLRRRQTCPQRPPKEGDASPQPPARAHVLTDWPPGGRRPPYPVRLLLLTVLILASPSESSALLRTAPRGGGPSYSLASGVARAGRPVPGIRSTILLGAAAASAAAALTSDRDARAAAETEKYPVDFAAGAVWRCTVAGCSHGLISTKHGYTAHQTAHRNRTIAIDKHIAAMREEGAFHTAYKTHNPRRPPSAKALTSEAQLEFLFNADVAALTLPGRFNLIDRVPEAAKPLAAAVFTQALNLSTDSDPIKKGAGLNLLAIFGAAVLDKPLRAGVGSRATNQLMDNLSALAAGDYIAVLDKLHARGDARLARPPSAPKPPPAPDDPSASAPPISPANMSVITKLIRTGNYSKAATALAPERAAAATDLNVETVHGLFPAAGIPLDLDALHARLPSCPVVVISTDDIRQALRKTARGKAEGVTGLTNDHLLDMVGWGDKTDAALIAALANFATAYVGGAFIDCPHADWLTRARFVPLIKSEADGTAKVAGNGGDAIRPLGMQETLTNLCGRAFLNEDRKTELLAIFEPLGQYGLGTRSGCQAVALAVTTWLHKLDPSSTEPLAILQSDLSNAFNEFETMPALLSTHQHYPKLYPPLVFGYARTRELLWAPKDGSPLIALHSTRGSAQGDVFASLYFAFAAIDSVIAANEAPDTCSLFIVDDAHLHSPVDLSAANAAFLAYSDSAAAAGLRPNIPKSLAYCPTTDLTAADAPPVSGLCTPVPPDKGVVSVGVPIGSDAFVAAHVERRMAPYLRQLRNLTYYAASYPEEAYRLLEVCFAHRADFLAGNVSPHLAHVQFTAYDAALHKVLCVIFPAGPPAPLYWPRSVGGWGLARPLDVTRPAIYIVSQLNAAYTLASLNNPTAFQLVAPGGAFIPDILAAAALLPAPALSPPLQLELQNLFSTVDSTQLTHAELLSTFVKARTLAKSAVSDCGVALMADERPSLSAQQLHIIAGNASTDKLSTAVSWQTGSLDQRHHERLAPCAWSDLAHATLGVCPPRLIGFTEPGDPLGRNAFSQKAGGGLIKRHNAAAGVVHQIEREAGRASRMEVTGLYPGSAKRVDTHGIVGNTCVAISTDVRVVDPHTCARVAAGATVESVVTAAEKEKDAKYNSPGDRAVDGSTLSPLVFTPGGRIGLAAEQFLRRLAGERARILLPPGEPPSPASLKAIYRSYRRRLAHAIARGLAAQLAIYGLERRVGPPSASALRAAYPFLVSPLPNSILGQHAPAAGRRSGNHTRFGKKRARNPGR